MSQADWEALAALQTGFQSGKASSAQINKAIRQASFIAAALAQFVSEKSGQDVLDDGDLPGFVTKMTSGFAAEYLSRENPFGDIKADGADAVSTALSNLGLGGLSKYGAPLIGKLIEWPLEQLPHEVWPDCGMEFIPYMAQSFDGAKYPLLSQLHPTNVLPADMRAYVARGWDNGRGVDTGRALMSTQGDAIRNITGTLSGVVNYQSGAAAGAFTNPSSGNSVNLAAGQSGVGNPSFDASRVVPTAAENRVKTVAWNFIVRAK